MSHLDELDEYEAELELRLKKEYTAVFGLFRYCVVTQDSTYLCNKLDLRVLPQASYPFFHVTMDDVWVWDKNRPTRMIPRAEVYTSSDVTIEELRGEGEMPGLTPEALAETARRNGVPLLSATYSEPVVFWEYVRDTAIAGRRLGVRSTVVSNGYIQDQALKDVLPLLAAMKVDLKAFTERFYRELVRGELKPVLKALEVIKASGTWLEIVVLLIPGQNDSEQEIRDLSRWVKANLGAEVPVHFTRFHPTYRLTNLPPTPIPTLERAWQVAKAEGLAFPYLGNVPGHPGENTTCPGCGTRLIRRVGFQVLDNALQGGKCPQCKRAIPGVWS